MLGVTSITVNGSEYSIGLGASLRGANLYKADLRWTDLRRADLYEAILSWALLDKADLRGANLQQACLYKADLRGVRINVRQLDWAVNAHYAQLGWWLRLQYTARTPLRRWRAR